MLKRIFDTILSLFGLIILLPFMLIIAIFIKLDSKGPVFFKQVRVTKNGREFKIFKYRTMRVGSDKYRQITVGKDNRITKVGAFLRKYKLDEIPQLINVLIGDMSLVGPRPEVPKYVALYTDEQKEILKVRAGITDYASIEFSDENDLLASEEDPEKAYIEKVMPKKIELNKKYISEISILTDIKIILLTIKKILK
ncbi:Putative colanic biosynthesis UDP-glucose lipid carrier transferase [Fusobacterium polymorphum]|uniref:Possible glycosyltransferase n=1 Tax=Fusobacterium polymorphum ATCC 10953 TaxID=393480 RepID=A5TVH5_FUSNP|nr:sugar transferase [Fusobacterium polymorphum]EDK88900.1 possible glycosyltransferase [Fusobacterium polymorphum ATCC 10953]UTI53389.1 sugar transferase [Fusobacterium polymorphum]WRL67911.1 sugar transferase [Fusobacterium polymorphum]CKG69516.1 Putative colanic biosynthesis UDP-glucose lipid carrier transferase [Fusobacterium polymorphum]